MSAHTNSTERLLDAGLIAVLRADDSRHLPGIAHALVEAGITAIEVTLTTPGAVAVLAELARDFDDAAIVGAGTVLTVEQAEQCVAAGAHFLVSPAVSPEVMDVARAAGLVPLPGTFTPTEILAAQRTGARAVKLFPASVVGPAIVPALHGPFPDVAIIPTGGVGIGDIGDWIGAGAAAVGLGGSLLGSAVHDGADAALRERARRAADALAQARARL